MEGEGDSPTTPIQGNTSLNDKSSTSSGSAITSPSSPDDQVNNNQRSTVGVNTKKDGDTNDLVL